MRTMLAAALAMLTAEVHAKARPTILDMHMHAMGEAEEGPPPMGMCTPIRAFPAWDQRRPYSDFFARHQGRKGALGRQP